MEVALTTFYKYITEAKNKDAALSAFDRDIRAKKIEPDMVTPLRELFQPIRDERISKRKLADIGGVAEKRIFKLSDVEYNIKLAKSCLDKLERPADVMLSLLFMTGRRTAEVAGDTKFLKKSFKGTIKGGKEFGEARYLCSHDRIISALTYLRNSGWRGLSVADANKICAVPLMRRLEIFKGIEKVHDLRKMHMAVWIRRLSKRSSLKKLSPHERAEFIGRFVNDALGHTNPVSAIPYLNCQIK